MALLGLWCGLQVQKNDLPRVQSPGFNRAGAFLPWVLSCSGHKDHCEDHTHVLSCSQPATAVSRLHEDLHLFSRQILPPLSLIYTQLSLLLTGSLV